MPATDLGPVPVPLGCYSPEQPLAKLTAPLTEAKPGAPGCAAACASLPYFFLLASGA